MGVWEGGSSGFPLGALVFLFLISFAPIFVGVSLYSKFFKKKFTLKKSLLFSVILTIFAIIVFFGRIIYWSITRSIVN